MLARAFSVLRGASILPVLALFWAVPMASQAATPPSRPTFPASISRAVVAGDGVTAPALALGSGPRRPVLCGVMMLATAIGVAVGTLVEPPLGGIAAGMLMAGALVGACS
jgi:hypothetical protein